MVKLVIFIMIMVVVKNYFSDSSQKKRREDARYPENQRTGLPGGEREVKRPSYSPGKRQTNGRKSMEQTMTDLIEEARRQDEKNENRRRQREEQARKEREKKEHERKRLELQKRKEELVKKEARRRAEEQRRTEESGYILTQKGKNKKKDTKKNQTGRKQMNQQDWNFENDRGQETNPGDTDSRNETGGTAFGDSFTFSSQIQEQAEGTSIAERENSAEFRLEHYLDPLTAPFYPGNQKEERKETFQVDDYLFPALSSFYPDADRCIREISLQNSDVVL